MDLENILLEYGNSKNIGRLQLDSTGICNVLVNDHLISFEKSLDKQGFFIYSAIGILPAGEDKEMGLMLLESNLFGKETGQASIGYIAQSRTIVLFEYFELNSLEYSQFIHRFNKYIQYLFYWLIKLEAKDIFDTPADLPIDKPEINDKKIFYA